MERKTVVIIDDEFEISNMLARFFKTNGYSTTMAHTLEEGKKLLELNKPEWLFLDINLPDGNGLQAIGLYKKQSGDTKIVIMSAMASDQNKKKAKEEGVVSFLAKPFSLSAVKQILQTS